MKTRIEYVDQPDGQVAFVIKGANGEVQARSERYDSKSNAKRGAGDLLRSLQALATAGEIAL